MPHPLNRSETAPSSPPAEGQAAESRYCVVIPAFNASRTISDLIRQVKHYGLDVVVVDDGSRDATASLAAEAGALVLSHPRNEGKGRALRTAFERVLRASYHGVITMDSDGQHDPAELPSLIRACETTQAAVVVGNRLTDSRAMPPVRRWTNRFMSSLVSLAAGQSIPDSQCGFRLIRREVLGALPLRTSRFEIETEVLLEAARRWSIVSVPIRAIYDAHHRSHIRPLHDGWRFLRTLASHLIRR